MRATNEQLAKLTEFYLPGQDGKPNLFEIWEDGGARGDSVTPSTYSAEYRNWMRAKLIAELDRTGGGMLSLGCGNAVIESEIARAGYRVLAVDALAEAVELAQAKGVDAVRADINAWSPEEGWSLIYMDGVLGHLYTPAEGLRPVMERIRSWLASAADGRAATFLASNDGSRNGEPAQPAPGVAGFHWLSAGYMRDEALAAGFDQVATEEFRYSRPVSGDRLRSIIVARVQTAARA